jgi:hypothetical protein
VKVLTTKLIVIKKKIKQYRFLFFLINKIRFIQYDLKPYLASRIKFNVQKYMRISGLSKNSRFEKLKSFKNVHKGERCFIVATGPSLKISDLDKLKDEITFSMNSICLAFEDTTWRPTYYGIQYIAAFKKFKKYIEALNCRGVFLGDTIPYDLDSNYKSPYYFYPLNLLNHSRQNHKHYRTKFSENIFSEVFDGYTITYTLIQIAAYMGFNEIILLGVDCNYLPNLNHHFKNYDIVDPTFALASNKMICAFREAKKFAEKNDLKIYNATRGGKLEVFERVDLDDIITLK